MPPLEFVLWVYANKDWIIAGLDTGDTDDIVNEADIKFPSLTIPLHYMDVIELIKEVIVYAEPASHH